MNKIIELLSKHWIGVDNPPINSCRVLIKMKYSNRITTGWYWKEGWFKFDNKEYIDIREQAEYYMNIDQMFYDN